MSNKIQEKLSAIAKIVFGEESPAAPSNQFAGSEYQLADGTVVLIDKMEIGGMVMIGDQPAPAGEYTLMDGTKFTVSEGGVIASVGEAIEAPDMSANPSPNYDEQFTQMNEKISAYESKFGEVNTQIQNFGAELKRVQEGMKQIIDLVSQLSELPKETPAAAPANGTKFSKQEEKEQKLKTPAAKLSAINKN